MPTQEEIDEAARKAANIALAPTEKRNSALDRLNRSLGRSPAQRAQDESDSDSTLFSVGFQHSQVSSFEISHAMPRLDPNGEPLVDKDGKPIMQEYAFQFKNNILIIADKDETEFERKLEAFARAVDGLDTADKINIFQMKEISNLISVADRGVVRGAQDTGSIKSPTVPVNAARTGMVIKDGKLVSREAAGA